MCTLTNKPSHKTGFKNQFDTNDMHSIAEFIMSANWNLIDHFDSFFNIQVLFYHFILFFTVFLLAN